MKSMRIYLKAYREIFILEKWMLPLTILLSSSMAISPFINIYFSSTIISKLSSGVEANEMIRLVIIAVAANFILYMLSQALETPYMMLRERMQNKEKKKIIAKLYHVDYSLLENSEFQYQLHLYYESMKKIYSPLLRLCWLFRDFVNGLCSVVISLVMLIPLLKISMIPSGKGFIHSPWLLAVIAGVLTLGIVVIFLLSRVLGKKMYQTRDQYAEKDRLFHCYQDILFDYRSGKEIRLFQEQKFIETEATSTILTDGENIIRKFATHAALNGSFVAVIGAILGFGIYSFIAIKGMAGMFDVGDLVRYCGAFMQVVFGITNIAGVLGQGSDALPTIGQYFDIIKMRNEMEYGTKDVDTQKICVEFKNVSFRYPGSSQYALKNVSLTIPYGEHIAIVGRNGSGKTTFIKLLCRLYDPQEGEILINGVDIKMLSQKALRELYSVVFQDYCIFPISVIDNIVANQSEQKENINLCLQQSDLYERIQKMDQKESSILMRDLDEGGIELSGGESQKLALARSLYKNAPIVILDEPTAALDPVSEYQIYEKFNDFTDKKTAVYISHRLSSCRFCERIAVFDQGQLTQCASHEELINDMMGLYYQLWNAQAQYYVGSK